MPSFRFEFHEKTKNNDITVELIDHVAALAKAKRAAGKMLVDSAIDPAEWLVRVYNDSDDLIGTIFRNDLLNG